MGNTSTTHQPEAFVGQNIGEEGRYSLSLISDDTNRSNSRGFGTIGKGHSAPFGTLLLASHQRSFEERSSSSFEVDGTGAPRICNIATVNSAIIFDAKRKLPAWIYLIGTYGKRGPKAMITWRRPDNRYKPEVATRGWRVWLAVPWEKTGKSRT